MALDEKARKEAGRIGEQIAADFLIRKGFRIIERNYRKPWGEIDIIAEKGGIVRFVEVKTLSRDQVPDVSRENNTYRPEEQAHPWKLRKVARTAEMYMNARKDPREYQIDVIGVLLNMSTRRASCRLFEQVL
jgi:putative endonuclease